MASSYVFSKDLNDNIFARIKVVVTLDSSELNKFKQINYNIIVWWNLLLETVHQFYIGVKGNVFSTRMRFKKISPVFRSLWFSVTDQSNRAITVGQFGSKKFLSTVASTGIEQIIDASCSDMDPRIKLKKIISNHLYKLF